MDELWYNTETHETRRARFQPSGFGWILKDNPSQSIEEQDDDELGEVLGAVAINAGVSLLGSLFDSQSSFDNEGDSGLVGNGGNFGGGGSSGDW